MLYVCVCVYTYIHTHTHIHKTRYSVVRIDHATDCQPRNCGAIAGRGKKFFSSQNDQTGPGAQPAPSSISTGRDFQGGKAVDA
jgi:hypothetical protein